jgi:metal-responsive CopG/Arc/MetJ family transcriptional regulator
MTIVTIRLSEKILREVDLYAHDIHIPRTEYIRMAIEQMNENIKSKKRSERLKAASLRVRKESIRINKEFSEIEDDFED